MAYFANDGVSTLYVILTPGTLSKKASTGPGGMNEQ
jgi:hypothetical protein